MTRSWNIVMTRILEHCAETAMEHCDDTVMEHCDDKNSGALCGQGPWSIVMTRSWNILITRILEHCYDNGHGAL